MEINLHMSNKSNLREVIINMKFFNLESIR